MARNAPRKRAREWFLNGGAPETIDLCALDRYAPIRKDHPVTRMKRETKFPWWGWLGVICLLPVIYVLSVFPVIWVVRWWDLPPSPWLMKFYYPIAWAVRESASFGRLIDWVAEWLGVP